MANFNGGRSDRTGIGPADVEKGGAALLALSLQARGADSTKGKQLHEEM
jgi:hypothetical protein